MAPTAAMTVRAAVVAVLLLLRCCSVILAPRPLTLLHAVAERDDHGWRLEQDSGALIIEVLDKGTGPSGPGMGNCQFKDPHHPSCQPAAAPSLAKDIAAYT